MTKEELEAFTTWWDQGIALPVDVGYDCAIVAWEAACEWQKAQDKDIPMKYKRMEFNAKLQEENQRLLDRIEGLEKEVQHYQALYVEQQNENRELRGELILKIGSTSG